MDRDLINQSVCLGESLKLSLNVSFTLDSTGSNPVHSNKDLLNEGIFLFAKFFVHKFDLIQKIIIKYTKTS